MLTMYTVSLNKQSMKQLLKLNKLSPLFFLYNINVIVDERD